MGSGSGSKVFSFRKLLIVHVVYGIRIVAYKDQWRLQWMELEHDSIYIDHLEDFFLCKMYC